MGKRRPKDIGTDAERPVARFLAVNGWAEAERRALRGTSDAGDITGTPGVCWEVKGGAQARNASDRDIADWMAETEAERVNARADIGVLVVQRRGVGPANAGRWWAVLRLGQVVGALHPHIQVSTCECCTTPVRMLLADAVRMVRAAGYGDPLTPEDAPPVAQAS